MGRILTFNTLFWVRPSIGFLQLHGHYPREVANLHAYTSGGGQSVVSKQKRIRGHNSTCLISLGAVLKSNTQLYANKSRMFFMKDEECIIIGFVFSRDGTLFIVLVPIVMAANIFQLHSVIFLAKYNI